MKDNFMNFSSQDQENKSYPMGMFISDNSNLENLMEEGNIYGKMDILMMEISPRVTDRESEF